MIQSHTKFENLSKTTENAKSSPSAAIDKSDPSSIDMETAGTGSSRIINASKKRKADFVDGSAPTSSLSRPGSESELPHGKRKRSKEEKKQRKKTKKKGRDDDKEYTRN